MIGGRGSRGNGEEEGSTPADFTLDPDLSSMRFDDRLGDVKTEAACGSPKLVSARILDVSRPAVILTGLMLRIVLVLIASLRAALYSELIS